MKTIVEPKERIDMLWGIQRTDEAVTYRMMRYVIRIDHNGDVFLLNVITGQLVKLNQAEAELLEKLPSAFTPAMELLIKHHFVVPNDFDEHQKVVGIRTILRKLTDQMEKPGINHITIFPTTACNARCYYCFEQGIKPETMTEQTANQVVKFINDHCAGKKVWIRWFGGEPTVSANRISQICEGLHQYGVEFSSKITSNGYLFDEKLIEEACSLWNLYSVMISVDGKRERYNRVKAYVNACADPYERVMKNIGLLLAHGVHVNLRMNFDKQNYLEFKDLLAEAKERFDDNPLLDVYVHQINGHYHNVDSNLVEGDEKWFSEKILELNNLSREAGLLHKKDELPKLDYRWCIAARNDSVTILPQGQLVSCPERVSPDQYKGDLTHGINNPEQICYWKQFADYKRCWDCCLFPECVKILNCAGKDRCLYKMERMDRIKKLVCNLADTSADEQ